MKIKTASKNFLKAGITIVICIVLIATSFSSAVISQDEAYSDKKKIANTPIENSKKGTDVNYDSLLPINYELKSDYQEEYSFVPGEIIIKFIDVPNPA